MFKSIRMYFIYESHISAGFLYSEALRSPSKTVSDVNLYFIISSLTSSITLLKCSSEPLFP